MSADMLTSVPTRTATAADLPFLERLFRSVHGEDLAAMGLPAAQLESLLAMQFRGQRMSYAKDFPDAVDRIVLDGTNQAPVGRILVEANSRSTHLIDIALLPEARGKGTGGRLLEELLAGSRATGVPVRLMVRPGNPAFRLYRRLGFEVTDAGMQMSMEFAPRAGDKKSPASGNGGESGEAFGAAWERALGTVFDAGVTRGGGPIRLPRLRLETISRSGPRSFSLIFLGPVEEVLEQASYLLTPEGAVDAAEAGQLVFLVPVGPRDGSMQYEAVFNG